MNALEKFKLLKEELSFNEILLQDLIITKNKLSAEYELLYRDYMQLEKKILRTPGRDLFTDPELKHIVKKLRSIRSRLLSLNSKINNLKFSIDQDKAMAKLYRTKPEKMGFGKKAALGALGVATLAGGIYAAKKLRDRNRNKNVKKYDKH